MVNIGPPKKCVLPANIFEDFFSFNPWTLFIMKILKPFLKKFVLGPRKISTKMTGLTWSLCYSKASDSIAS